MEKKQMNGSPVVIASWEYGRLACEAALKTLGSGGSVLDAAQNGVLAVELDPSVDSVGYGGLPNADGVVELDAALMDGPSHESGAVFALTDIRSAVLAARLVMDRTRHASLAGENARRFALANGLVEEETLTPEARSKWEQWRNENASRPDEGGHDTVGVCVLDTQGDLAAACTTSGLRWKVPGRVGDTPIVGSGLYVDNEIGAATATGNGDEILKVSLCSRIIWLMENGYPPQEACEESLRYLLRKRSGVKDLFAACVALGKDGSHGSAATYGTREHTGKWTYAVSEGESIAVREGAYVDG